MTAEHRTVFVAGATGSMGLAAVEALRSAGHEVVGVARSEEGGSELRRLGASAVKVDLFDTKALTAAMHGADAVVHFATKIPQGKAMLKAANWKQNDHLRRGGTRALLEAARQNGIRRFIFESLAMAYPNGGADWLDETVPLAPQVTFMQSVLDAEAMLAEFGREGGEPVALRYSRIYGPGRASDGFLDVVAQRGMPIIGTGENYVSSIHTDDVGTSVVAALGATPGVYNVSDDEPVWQRDYVTTLANALMAPSPRRVPTWMARMLMGRATGVMTSSQRVSNRRFREETGWAPAFRSVEEGWPNVVRRSGRIARVVAA